MSETDTDSRLDEAAREKMLEERDNKSVLEFDFKKYVMHQIRLLDEYEITTAEFVGSMLSLQCLVGDLDAANTEMAQLLVRSKQVEYVRSRCKMQLRKLMEELE